MLHCSFSSRHRNKNFGAHLVRRMSIIEDGHCNVLVFPALAGNAGIFSLSENQRKCAKIKQIEIFFKKIFEITPFFGPLCRNL